ncbi:MAG: outer membrane beta-barrel protein [Candidatus Omnitrophota bacterium]
MKKAKIQVVAGLVALTAVLCLWGTANAGLDNPDLPDREGIKVINNIKIHGAFRTSEELDTNIYLSDAKAKFDAITVLVPSGGIEIPMGDSKISADYEADINLYGKYTTENHINQRARALAEINLTDYKITVDEVLKDYTDRASDENSRRIERFNNNMRVGVEAQFNKFGFDAGYTNIFDTYGSKDDLIYQSITYGDRDRVYNIVDGSISYRFMPKTSIFLESDLGFINYYNSSIPPNSWYIQTFVGLKGRPTNKILANIKGGFKYQGYSSSNIYNDKPFAGLVASGGIDYSVTNDDTLGFGIEKNTYESTYQNMNYYDACIVSLDYKHRFNKKLLFKSFGSYQINLYPGQTVEGGLYDKRYDNFYSGGLSFRYDIQKWASLEFKYEYSQKSSRFHIYDYVDNRIIFSGTGGF